jgi:hypothetical protein
MNDAYNIHSFSILLENSKNEGSSSKYLVEIVPDPKKSCSIFATRTNASEESCNAA